MSDIAAEPILKYCLMAVLCVIALCCILALIFCVREKRFTDKALGANMIITLTVNAICILAVYFGEDYVIDVALVYALLGFVTVVVLCRLIGLRPGRRGEKK